MSLSHGDTIDVPSNAYNTFQWRAEANLHNGPFQLHCVDSCTQPLSAAGAICDISITEVPTSDTTVDILPQPTVMVVGNRFVLPKDIPFTWTVHSGGIGKTVVSFTSGEACNTLNASSAFS
jgi:hypothetical protein